MNRPSLSFVTAWRTPTIWARSSAPPTCAARTGSSSPAGAANLAQAIRTIKEQNIFVYCADLGGAPLEKTDLSGPVALVLGSEGSGPSALTRKLCDAAVTLEMAPGGSGVDSYNVSVAAGILLYDMMRRRR